MSLSTNTQNNRGEGLYPSCRYFSPIMSTECKCPREKPQQGRTVEDISSRFPLWSLLFSSLLITCTTGGLLCGITRANGATHFCCRKSDSHTVTAKTVIKKPKLQHDVGQFSSKRGVKVLRMKWMGLSTSYGMCKLLSHAGIASSVGFLRKNKTLK